MQKTNLRFSFNLHLMGHFNCTTTYLFPFNFSQGYGIESETLYRFLYFSPQINLFYEFFSKSLVNQFEEYETVKFFYIHFFSSIIKFSKCKLKINKNTVVKLYIYQGNNPLFKCLDVKIKDLCKFEFWNAIKPRINFNNIEANNTIFRILFTIENNDYK